MSSFLGNLYKFNFFVLNLKIEIRGQIVNFKKIEGSNYNFWKFWGANLQFFGSNWNFWKIWGPKCKFWKII